MNFKILLFAFFSLTISCSKDSDLFAESIDQSIEDEILNEGKDNDFSNPVVDNDAATTLKAFPTAEGAGAFSQGGRGGKVLHVTTLEDGNQEGTFRWAVTQQFPRIIVFDVSGVIELNSWLGVGEKSGDLTIAGQTAPEGGVTIRHYGLGFYRMNNLIMRYLRFEFKGRFDPNGMQNKAALYVEGCTNAVLDHCSIRYAWGSAALGMWDDLRPQGDNTVQFCLLSDSQTGALVGSAPSIESRAPLAGKNSFHHNLFAHISHRFPNINGDGKFEVINNVAYNYQWKLSSIYNKSESNFINNYYRGGPASNVLWGARLNIGDYLKDFDPEYNNPKVYTRGNVIEDSRNTMKATDDSWSKFVILYNYYDRVNMPAEESKYRSYTEFPPLGIPISTQSAMEAYEIILGDVGANSFLRQDGSVGRFLDTVDERNINDVKNRICSNCPSDGSSSLPDLTNPETLFFAIPNNRRQDDYDTDRDGMPNIWEMANGLNPEIDDSAQDADGDGYTNIEEFLNMVDVK